MLPCEIGKDKPEEVIGLIEASNDLLKIMFLDYHLYETIQGGFHILKVSQGLIFVTLLYVEVIDLET